MSEDMRYIIIGAGMSGILAAIKLKAQGISNYVVYEKGDSVGGTWRENRYPGLTCDVPAHCYTYSFAPHPGWSAFYAPGPEIRAYFEAVVDRFGVRDHLRFQSEVVACRWREGRWHVELADGRSDSGDIIIAASGVLHHPNIPAIAGLDDFAGPVMHSARWDDQVQTSGRRVGIIGNGSTGVQIVTGLSGKAAHLVHFQRSPQWIMPVEQFAYSDADRAAFVEDPDKVEAIRNGDEYWGGIRRFNEAIINPDSSAMHEIEELCRQNLENSVHDPVLREKLRPDYRAACKRLIYSWNYYEHAQRPNVMIETGRILRVEPQGVRMEDGSFHALDVLVLATGFRADRFIRPTKVVGRDGIDLDDVWRDRPSAYFAITIPGFPNFFMLNGPTGPVGNFSLIDIAEQQWGYIAQVLAPLQKGQASRVECRVEAMSDYDTRRTQAARATIFGSGCTSWYLDKDGIPLTWPWSYDSFVAAMRKPAMDAFDYR